jgi:hypothetical protein
VSPSTTEQQWTFTFTASNADGQSATATQSLEQLGPLGSSFTQTPNWSGYVIPSNSALFTDASGEWTVPTLDCSQTPDSGASTWVGIGGEGYPNGGNPGALLQTGVTDNCVNGEQQDFAWFEIYPSTPNHSFSFNDFPVSPGDLIAASVFQSTTGKWTTRVDNLTTGISGWMVTGESWGVGTDASDTFSEQGNAAGLSYSGGYTAEWIEEDYVGSNGLPIPFADYGTVTFSDLETSLSPWYLTTSEGLEMVLNGVVVSTPSLPSGDEFSVSYTG